MVHLTYDKALHADPPPISVDFLETRFFREHGSGSSSQLPEPASLRALRPDTNSGIVRFEKLGLFVKYGLEHKVGIEEAQTLQAIHRAFPNNEIPVPELVAWRRSEGVNFIYMSLVDGITLESCWMELTEAEKTTITNQLQDAVQSLRSMQQHHGESFIGRTTTGSSHPVH